MELLLHPRLPQAVITRSLQSSTHIHMWDLNLAEAQALSKIEHSHPIQKLAGNTQEFGTAYTEGDPWDLNAPIFLELRRWDDLHVTTTLPLNFGQMTVLQSMAFSLDGHWIALANFEEQLCLFDRINEQSATLVDGGEFISGCTFSPDSQLLAAAHTFQGGGYVSIYRTQDGLVDPLHEELDRTSLVSPVGDFADTFTNMSFSPDGTLLAIYETKDVRGTIWYGDVVLYEIPTGKPRWLISLHHRDQTNQWIREMFLTKVRFEPDGETVLVGSPWGTVQRFAVTDATLLGEYSFGINEPMTTFDVEQTHRRIWTIDQAGKPKSCSLT